MTTHKQKFIELLDALFENPEMDSGEIDELLRAAGVDPVKLAAHY